MFLNTLLDIIYPISCSVCSAPSGRHLCDKCRAAVSVHPVEACCSKCGKRMMDPVSAGRVVAECAQCHAHPPVYDAARSAAAFAGPVRMLVHKLKYNRAVWLRRELAELLEACVIANFASERIHGVCPVPLSEARRRKRTYNQAELLSVDLAARAGLPHLPRVLRRTRNTPTQTTMGAEERRMNVAGAFVSPTTMKPWVYGRCILLVDDVMTTGATLSECASALKANGARRILAVTVARD